MRRTRIGHHCCADGSQLTWPTALSGNAISACNGRSLGHATPPTTPAQPSPHPSAQWGEPVNHLPIDPAAHSRRAWLPCPNCNHSHGCPQCQNNHNCQIHWQYLLKTAGTRVSLQCPTCAHLWTVDTTHARRREPDVVATIPLGGHARDVVVSPGAITYMRQRRIRSA